MPIRLSVPLPFEPPPPLLVSQRADAEGAADLAEAARWRCELQYLHEHRAQDEVELTVSFNVRADAAAADAGPAAFARSVVVRLIHSDDGEDVEALQLRRTSATTDWPQATYVAAGGQRLDLGAGVDDGDGRRYVLPPQPAQTWHGVSLRWGGFGVAQAQNARAALTAVRNRGLVDDTSGIPVYRTATVVAADVVAPRNRWSQDFDIGAGGERLESALDAALGELFGNRAAGQPLALTLSYAYAPGPDLPLVTLPVLRQPPQPFDAATMQRIAAALAAWQASNQPPTRRAEWQIGLVQYPQIAADTARPLLDLPRLVYRLR